MAQKTLKAETARRVKQLKRYRRSTVMRLVTRAYVLHRKGLESEVYNVISDEFTKLGGVYIKFLQGVLLQSAFMKNWRSPNRLNIFENLESEPLNIHEILREQLPGSKLSHITAVSPEPFAAGSFGQVYFGQHKDGTQIVIKVIRPLVRETLVYDLRLLGLFMKSFKNRLYKNMQLNINEAVEDFKRATLRETDYEEEARFADELYQAYKDHPTFIIPKTYLELCTPTIIVQEYLPGVSVAQLIKFQEQGIDIHAYVKENFGSDLDTQLTTVGSELIYGIFSLPRIQGDPHPGNIKLLEGNKVGMIDFGISAKSPQEKAAFYALLQEYKKVLNGQMDVQALFGQFLRFFVSDLYKALKKITALLPSDDKTNDLTRQMGAVAEKNFQKEMGTADVKNIIEHGNILTMMNKVVNKGNRFGLVMKFEDSEMLRAAQSYMALVESMGGKTTVLPQAFEIALNRVARDFPDYTQDAPNLPSINRAMETISRWLERVADKDPALFKTFLNKISQAQTTKKPQVKLAPKLNNKDDKTGNT
jgi:predicted unusual protein kinase regulating ubiquinone biosynthesis (AarF/ABC1/UbiB family)